jgi:hypothetical protein
MSGVGKPAVSASTNDRLPLTVAGRLDVPAHGLSHAAINRLRVTAVEALERSSTATR